MEVEVRECEFGLGLFASRTFQNGYVVAVLSGPVTDAPTDYAIEPTAGLFIETEHPWRLINHSCEPNLELIGLRVVVASTDIEQGDQLFLDYGTFIHDSWTMVCNCRNKHCRGIIGAPRT